MTTSEKRRPVHCDDLVVHAPGVCKYCDELASDLQQERIAQGVNFTGESDPSKKQCPAEARRSVHTINRWGGNRPVDPNIMPVFEED